MLSQKQKLRFTSVTSLLLQLATMVCGFILPRYFLETYGSAVNGLVSSISQFLVFVALAECGVGAVVQSALYRPLANKDKVALSKIIVSAEHFFRNIAKVLLLYVFLLALVFPFFAGENFDFIFTGSLIFIIAISSFAQYYFGITYRLLLTSDQFGFIPLLIQLIALILNCVISVFLMKLNCSVHIVKLVSSIIFVIQPLIISWIAKRWYEIDYSIWPENGAIEQKWNGLAQHISAVVLQCSGTVVLTLFSTMQEVSVYSIYFLVVNGVKSIVMSWTNGMQAFLGNLYAKGDIKSFALNFERFEWKIHFVVTFVFSVTSVMIVPFVSIYTKGITDVEYVLPVFGTILVAAWGVYCIRLPYNVAVLAVGHYRQTQASAIIEAVINIVVSIVVVLKFGIIGVAVGTLVAMIYRTFYLANYISENIINRKISSFFKHLLVDFLSVSLFMCCLSMFGVSSSNYIDSIIDWICIVLQTAVIGVLVVFFVNLIFYKKMIAFQKQKDLY